MHKSVPELDLNVKQVALAAAAAAAAASSHGHHFIVGFERINTDADYVLPDGNKTAAGRHLTTAGERTSRIFIVFARGFSRALCLLSFSRTLVSRKTDALHCRGLTSLHTWARLTIYKFTFYSTNGVRFFVTGNVHYRVGERCLDKLAEEIHGFYPLQLYFANDTE